MRKALHLMVIGILIYGCRPAIKIVETEVEVDKILHDTISVWEVFKEALMEVESNGNPNAIGKANDAGVLQITPIYVREVNNIQSNTVYTLHDRFDKTKSLEMFEVFNERHNPSRDIDRAIKLHNPNASGSYGKKVKNKMKELTERFRIGEFAFYLHGSQHKAEILSVEPLHCGNIVLHIKIIN